MKNIIIAGTDTDIGKTVCSALLMSVLQGTYFKPIQSGSKYDSDTQMVKTLSELDEAHFIPERYLLSEPLSPHLAAEIDGVIIDSENLKLPCDMDFNPLIIELAGGLMVPLNRQMLFIDVVKQWMQDGSEVILCAKNTLGTINHTLLSIEALQNRGIPILGIIFTGDGPQDNIKTIAEFSNVRVLGQIPKLDTLNKTTLRKAFYDNFDVDYFEENYGLR